MLTCLQAYLNLEASGRELESIVVGEIQKAYTVLAGILTREATQSSETAEKLKEGPLGLTKDYEWDTFVTNNKQMVDPRNPVRQYKNITYPGQEHPAAIEVKSGMLERKSKYLKNYTPGWYIHIIFLHMLFIDQSPGTFFRLPTSTNSNPRTASQVSRLSCHCISRNRSLAPSLNQARPLINSCSKAGKVAQCIEAILGCSEPRLMIQCLPGTMISKS